MFHEQRTKIKVNGQTDKDDGERKRERARAGKLRCVVKARVVHCGELMFFVWCSFAKFMLSYTRTHSLSLPCTARYHFVRRITSIAQNKLIEMNLNHCSLLHSCHLANTYAIQMVLLLPFSWIFVGCITSTPFRNSIKNQVNYIHGHRETHQPHTKQKNAYFIIKLHCN